MKKALIAFILFLLVAPLFPIFAQKFDGNETVVLKRSEIVDSSYFGAGESITIEGTINGDAYVAGGKVLIEGTINGDLLVAGGEVTVRGTVTEDVRAAGGQVEIAGAVGGNVTVAGGDVSIDDSARITGELVAGSGSLDIFGPVGGSVTIGGGQATLGSQIGGNVTAGVGQLEVTSNAKIAGDLSYYSEEQANIQDGAQIAGKVNFTRSDMPGKAGERTDDAAQTASGAGLTYKIYSAVTALIIGLILLALLPVYFPQMANRLNQKLGWSLLIGFIALIMIPFAAIVLLLTILGIPLAIFTMMVYAFLIYISKIVVALWVGQKILSSRVKKNQKVSPGWSLALGLLLWVVVTSIPVIGGIASFLTIIAGLGAMITQKRETYLSLKAKKLI